MKSAQPLRGGTPPENCTPADTMVAAAAATAFIDGLPITLASQEEVMAEIDRAIAARELGKYISITNTESTYHGHRIASHGEFIRRANFSLCDGVGVIVAGWAWGYRIARFNGPILQLKCSQEGLAKGWRHFFYGGKDGVAEEMAKRLKDRFPGLVVCGLHAPPFREMSVVEKAAIIEEINRAKPDIVWVGLGLIKQERWIAENLGRVQAPWMVGVGAAFDYHAGAVPWAPAALRALGLEWLFRLIVQPKLRAKRYWWSAIYVFQSFFKGLLTGQFLRKERPGRDSSSLTGRK